MVTVFTATYNRAKLLERLYESLKKQTDKDFEWIVIDDGSEDETEEYVKEWSKRSDIQIIYRRQFHGGKHRAINHGVSLARGNAFFIVDSDDVITEDAIQWINDSFPKILTCNNIAGISGTKGDMRSGKALEGSCCFENKYEKMTLYELIERTEQKGKRCPDYAEVYKAEVLREHPFPEFDDEDFLSENAVWYAIANDGMSLLWYEKCIYLCQYLEDGLTRNMSRNLRRNFRGWGYCIGLEVKHYGISNAETMSKCLRYFGYVNKNNIDDICGLLSISKEDVGIIRREYKSNCSNLADFIESNNIEKIAVYGMGARGHAFLEMLEAVGISAICGIDRNVMSDESVPVYKLGDDLPEIDCVCISILHDESLVKEIHSYLSGVKTIDVSGYI